MPQTSSGRICDYLRRSIHYSDDHLSSEGKRNTIVLAFGRVELDQNVFRFFRSLSEKIGIPIEEKFLAAAGDVGKLAHTSLASQQKQSPEFGMIIENVRRPKQR